MIRRGFLVEAGEYCGIIEVNKSESDGGGNLWEKFLVLGAE